jgi:WD40 repeat protein
LRYWIEWPDSEAQFLTLDFLPQQVALSSQGECLLAIGPEGQWAHFGLMSGVFNILTRGRIEARPICCTLDSSGEKWAVGTLAGAVFYGDGRRHEIIARHTGMVRACAIDLDNQVIASGGQDGNLQLTSSNGTEICQVACGGWVNDLAFTNDGEELVVATEDGTLLGLSLGGGKANPETWWREQVPLTRVCPNQAGSAAAVLAANYRVRLVMRPAASSQKVGERGELEGATPSRTTSPLQIIEKIRPTNPIASGDSWLPFSGTVKYLGHQGNNQTLLAVDSTGQTCRFDLQASPLKGETLLESSGSILAAATSGTQHELIMVYAGLGAAKVVQLRLDKASAQKVVWPKKSWRQLWNRPTDCTAAAFSPDQQTLILARAEAVDVSFAGTVLEIYDTKLWKPQFRFSLQKEWISVLAIANQARRVLVGYSDFSLAPKLLELGGIGERPHVLPLDGCMQAALSANGQTLVIIDRHRNAWVTKGGLNRSSFRMMGQNAACCSLSPDGTWLLLGDYDGGITLISLAEQKPGRRKQEIFPAGLTWTPSYCKIDPTTHNVLVGGQRTVQVFRLDQDDL